MTTLSYSSRHPLRRFRRRLARVWFFLPFLAALAGLILAAAIIAMGGCGARPDEPAAPSLRVRLASDPVTLDPVLAADASSLAVVSQIFDGLVELDPATGETRPALAASWESRDGGTTLIFHLRDGARFHHQREVDAADVVFSFERLLSPALASDGRWVLAGIRGAAAYAAGRAPRVEGLQALDARTVAIRLEQAGGTLLSRLAAPAASVVPADLYADPAGPPELPVGAGPYRLALREPGSRIVLAAHEGHPSAAAVLPRVVFRVIPSAEEALREYLAGGLDILDEIPAARRADAEGRLGPEIRRHVLPGISYVAFNHAREPFGRNRALRQALNWAIDREALCRSEHERLEIPASGILPPGIAGHNPALRAYGYDPARAKSLLAKAGFPEGRGLPELSLGCSSGPADLRLCERIRDELGAIGVRVALRTYEPGDLIRAIEGNVETGSDLELFRIGWLADSPDPDALLRPTLHSASTPREGNHGRYANPAFDRRLDLARREDEPAARLRQYHAAERIALEDAPWILLNHYGGEMLVKPYVVNFRIPAAGGHLAPLHEVALDPGLRLASL